MESTTVVDVAWTVNIIPKASTVNDVHVDTFEISLAKSAIWICVKPANAIRKSPPVLVQKARASANVNHSSPAWNVTSVPWATSIMLLAASPAYARWTVPLITNVYRIQVDAFARWTLMAIIVIVVHRATTITKRAVCHANANELVVMGTFARQKRGRPIEQPESGLDDETRFCRSSILVSVHADWTIRIVRATHARMVITVFLAVCRVFAIITVGGYGKIDWPIDLFGWIGSTVEVCNKETGACLCKSNFTGQICEQCAFGFFNHPTCEACACDPVGVVYDGSLIISFLSSSAIADRAPEQSSK